MAANENGPQLLGTVSKHSQCISNPALRVSIYGEAPGLVRLAVRRVQDYPTPALILTPEEAGSLVERLAAVLTRLDTAGACHG